MALKIAAYNVMYVRLLRVVFSPILLVKKFIKSLLVKVGSTELTLFVSLATVLKRNLWFLFSSISDE